LEDFALQGLWKKFWCIFTIYVFKNEAVCRKIQTHSGCSPLARFKVKTSGRNLTIYVSKIEAVSCWVQTHFWSFRLASLMKKFSAHFFDLCVQKRSCLPKSSDAFWKFSACKVHRKKFFAQLHDICGQKRSGSLWSSDAFWTFSPCMIYIKCSGHIFTICASKNEAVCCEVQAQFGSSLPARFTEKVLGAIPRFVRPKTNLCAVKFRCILEVLWLRVVQKKFWAQFHDLCVQKRTCLLWSSDAFWKFSASKVYRESSGQIFTIYVLKNKAVCCEVHTHFGSDLPASFTKKALGAISQLMRPKTELFAG